MPPYRCQRCGAAVPPDGKCTSCGETDIGFVAPLGLADTNTNVWRLEPVSEVVAFQDSAEIPPTVWVHCQPLEPIRLDGDVTIGRGAETNLVLPHMEVSRHHATLRRIETGEVVVIDNKSANGTHVNGEPVQTRVVKPGDRIKIGPYEITLHETTETPSERATQADDTVAPQGGQDLTSTMLMGKIGKIRFAEILQYVEFHKKSGKLSFRGPDGMKGELTVANGKPLHASWGNALRDEAAVRAMLEAHGGVFSFSMDADAGVPSMRSSLGTLILEFSRRQDERHTRSEPKVSTEAKEFFQLLDAYTSRRNPLMAEARRQASQGFESAKNGDLEGAIAAFTRALDLDPTLALAWYNRGLAHESRGDRAAAVPDYARAIALEPHKLTYWLRRGIARGDLGDADGAIEDLTHVLAKSPMSAPAYTARSCARREKGDIAGALDDATRAINLDPRMAMAWCQRGLGRYKTGDTAGALADFQRYLALSPNGRHAPNVRALIAKLKV